MRAQRLHGQQCGSSLIRRECYVALSVALLFATATSAPAKYFPPNIPDNSYAENIGTRVSPSRLATADALQDSAKHDGGSQRVCSSHMFTPNYADEIGALQAGSWPRFPIRIWIDSSTVHDPEEMQGLKKGLSSWSDASGSVLGVDFASNRLRAQVEVQMVDRLPGGGSNLLMLGLSAIQTDGEVITGAYLKIVRASPAILRAIGSSGNPQLTRALMTQRTAAHEMGHVLMGTSNRHPSDSAAVLQQDNFTVMRPSAIDINTAKAKYCSLF